MCSNVVERPMHCPLELAVQKSGRSQSSRGDHRPNIQNSYLPLRVGKDGVVNSAARRICFNIPDPLSVQVCIVAAECCDLELTTLELVVKISYLAYIQQHPGSTRVKLTTDSKLAPT